MMTDQFGSVDTLGAVELHPLPPMPEVLGFSLHRRAALLERGELSQAEFWAAAAPWMWRADERYRASVELRVPRAGLTTRLGVKDTVDVAGFATRLGLRWHRRHPSRSAAPLRAARGLSTVAKLVATELNLGIGSGCGNPYFPRLDPAGSSTGSAVAVAAGICDISLGTDVLGSMRWPAGRCGVVGLRLTHGSAMDGVFPLCPSMDAPGWTARTAHDLRFAVDRHGLPVGRTPAGPYRVGVVSEALRVVAPQMRTGVLLTEKLLRAAGHTVREVAVGEPWAWRSAAWELCARSAHDALPAWRTWLTDDLGPATTRAIESGAAVTDARLAEIHRAMGRIRASVRHWFTELDVDALLLPLDPKVPAPPADTERSSIPLARGTTGLDLEDDIGYTPLASFCGLPAITFPVATTDGGAAPVAMQLVGRPHEDGGLIDLAVDLERCRGPLGLRPR